MSLSSAVDQIEAAIEAISGLARHPEERIEKLDDIGHAKADGSFSLYSIGGPTIYPELFTTPSRWWQVFGVDVCTVLTTSRTTTDKTVSSRGKEVIKALVASATPGADCLHITQEGDPETVNIENKKIIWRGVFRLLYEEA